MACAKSDTYNEYTSLLEAKQACEADSNCGKVCDKYCDERLSTLCVKGTAQIAGDQLGTCLYVHYRDSKYFKLM